MRDKISKKVISLVLSVNFILFGLAGCGNEVSETSAENNDIQLLEPVGTTVNYETAELRNMYNSQNYLGSVCPYVEEYSFEDAQRFLRYGAFPGQQVSRGTGLLYGDTKSLDEQIEAMEKSIKEQEESYQEFVEETKEALYEPRRVERDCGSILNNLEKSKPDEDSPEYGAWLADYTRFDGEYRSAVLTVDKLEQSMLERSELYELDHAYNLQRLSYLKRSRQKSILSAGMNGYVAALAYFEEGDWVGADASVMAVGDMSRKRIRCEYINGSTVRSAKRVYAIVGGVRYEVEYEPMDSNEYALLSKRDGDVYSTFYFQDDASEVEMGSYAVIVVVKDFREQVLTVSSGAVHSDGGSYYVYTEGENGERQYTPVRTGMRDGAYVEILSGLNEGDRVLSEASTPKVSETVEVKRGDSFYSYNSSGYLFYPTSTIVENPVEYGTSYFVEFHVGWYQQVKKGEPLATIRVVADEVGLQRKLTQLEREQERLQDVIAENNENNQKTIEAYQERIADLEEEIAEMKADFATTQVRAPSNGIITWIEEFEEDQLLKPGTRLCEVSHESNSFILVEDPGHILNYGNEASINYMNKDQQQSTTTGTIVTLQQSAVSGALRNDWTLISVSPEAMGDMSSSFANAGGWWNRARFDVSVKARKMDNVLLIPRRAVISKNNRIYVRVRYDDGRVVEQGIIVGGADTNNYWVVEGLTEGMVVCLE